MVQFSGSTSPYQFQWWALGLVKARPIEQKKGADQGIDGRLYFHDEGKGGKTKQIIFSVKGGKVTVSQIRDLVGVINREKAQIGVFLSLEPPTSPMRRETASAGFYESPWGKHPRIQLLTIEDLLGGRGIDCPQATDVTFKKAAVGETQSIGKAEDSTDGRRSRQRNERQERGPNCFRLAGKTCTNGFDRPRWCIFSRIPGAKRPLRRAGPLRL